MPQSLGTVSDGEGSIQVLVRQDRTTGQSGPPAYPFNLQAQVLNTHRVVPVNRTLVLQRKDQVQVSAAAAHKRTAPLRSRHLKASIELAEVVLAQEAIGRLQSADSSQPQFLRQTPLPSREVALRSTTSLRRIGRDHLHPQLPHGSTHLRQPVGIDLASRLGGKPEMTAAIAV